MLVLHRSSRNLGDMPQRFQFALRNLAALGRFALKLSRLAQIQHRPVATLRLGIRQSLATLRLKSRLQFVIQQHLIRAVAIVRRGKGRLDYLF